MGCKAVPETRLMTDREMTCPNSELATRPGIWKNEAMSTLVKYWTMPRAARKAPSQLTQLASLCRSFHELRPSAASSATVSYTHLRAHETGRNLVCRLL